MMRLGMFMSAWPGLVVGEVAAGGQEVIMSAVTANARYPDE